MMMQRRRLANRVDSGDLRRDEQETWITFAADENRYVIGSYIPSIAKKILQHAEAEIRWCYVRPTDARRVLERDIMEILDAYPRCSIEGVEATMPIGTLTVKGSPRKRDSPSKVINTPADAEAARRAFADGGPELGERLMDAVKEGGGPE